MKVLIIGLGSIGQRHVRNLRHILGTRIELLAYRVRKSPEVITPALTLDDTRNVEQEYGIRSFPALESALEEAPEVAFVCNPSGLHMDVALKCAEAGCDLFIEKPLSDSLTGVDRLVAAVRSRNRIAMVGYQMRFHPCLQQLRILLEEERIGRPLAVRTTVGEYLPFFHRYEDYRETYAARADLGGGVILSQIHEFDYLYSLFGRPRCVFALGGHWSTLEIDVEDTASILLECSRGGRTLPVHVQLDYLQYPPTRSCEVVGENGKVSIDLVANETTLYTNRQPNPERFKVEAFDRNRLFLDELKHFLQCVETRQQPLIGLDDGLQSLRMALAAKESIATRQIVQLGSCDEQGTCQT